MNSILIVVPEHQMSSLYKNYPLIVRSHLYTTEDPHSALDKNLVYLEKWVRPILYPWSSIVQSQHHVNVAKLPNR
jgi:hypothetical protein